MFFISTIVCLMCFMTSLQFCDMNDIKTNKNFSQLQYIFVFISIIPVEFSDNFSSKSIY